MTEYELVDTFYTIGGLSDQLITSFTTLLFAFLVASYLASSKLDGRMVALVVTLYSFMALRYVVLYYNVSGDLITLADTLDALGLQENSSLGWLEINAGMFTTLVGTTTAMFVSYLASIYFFFFTRHHGTE